VDTSTTSTFLPSILFLPLPPSLELVCMVILKLYLNLFHSWRWWRTTEEIFTLSSNRGCPSLLDPQLNLFPQFNIM